jgi:hypothetical protein
MDKHASINDKTLFNFYYKEELKANAVASNQEDTRTKTDSQRFPCTRKTFNTSSATARLGSITVGTLATPAPTTQLAFETFSVPGLRVRSRTSGSVNSLSTVNTTTQHPQQLPEDEEDHPRIVPSEI